MLSIEIKQGSILEQNVDAIVNAANCLGYMGGGVAGVIKRAGGIEIEEEAIRKCPIKVGEAIITTAGKLPFKAVIHAPTMEKPAMLIDKENVYLATKAACLKADEEGFSSIAIVGMGTGVGAVEPLDAAVEMKKAIDEVRDKLKNLKKIVLVDISSRMVEAFRKVFNNE